MHLASEQSCIIGSNAVAEVLATFPKATAISLKDCPLWIFICGFVEVTHGTKFKEGHFDELRGMASFKLVQVSSNVFVEVSLRFMVDKIGQDLGLVRV